jgi:hypothetical protein
LKCGPQRRACVKPASSLRHACVMPFVAQANAHDRTKLFISLKRVLRM